MALEFLKYNVMAVPVEVDDVVSVKALPSDQFCLLHLKDGSFYALHMSAEECASALWSAGCRSFVYDDPRQPHVLFDCKEHYFFLPCLDGSTVSIDVDDVLGIVGYSDGTSRVNLYDGVGVFIDLPYMEVIRRLSFVGLKSFALKTPVGKRRRVTL